MRMIVHSNMAAVNILGHTIPVMLKTGYLLSDKIVSMGFGSENINFIREIQSYDLPKRLKNMQELLNPEIYPDEIEKFNAFSNYIKEAKKIKHPPPDVLKKCKLFENILSQFFNAWLRDRKDEMRSIGYEHLADLMDGVNMGYYELNGENPEASAKRLRINMVDYLQLKLPDTDEKDSLMMLDTTLLNKDILGNVKFVQSSKSEAILTSNSYYSFVAELPDLNNLTNSEMIACRMSLQEPLKVFRETVSEWAIICNTCEDENAGAEYFYNNVKSVINDVNDIVKQNEILNSRLNMNTKFSNKFLHIGEITKEAMLNYYENTKTITTEERTIIEETYKVEKDEDRRIPMMFISDVINPELPLNETVEKDENIPMITRKYIEV